MNGKQFTKAGEEVYSAALQLARDNGHSQVTAYHLGVALLENSEGIPFKILQDCGSVGSP